VTTRRFSIEVDGLGKVYPPPPSLRSMFSVLLGGGRSLRGIRPALTDVGFGLEAGSSLGVIGRNGSGKTTLLRLLAGVLEPTTGKLTVRGRVAALIDLAAGVDPSFTGRENALLLGMLAGSARAEMAALLAPIRDFSGLGSAFDAPVRGYSAGMVLRLAFAVAVHAEPEILLVDEVLAVGDAFFQQRCLHRIRSLQERGCTTVLVTHDPSAVISFCDRALWLERGRVACAGEPAKVVREYMGARYAGDASLEESLLTSDVPASESDVEIEPAGGIPNVDHRYGDQRAVIVGVALRDARGRSLGEPRAGELVRVVVTCECREALRAPIVGFTLRSRLGEVVSASNTAYEGRQLPSLQPGDQITVEFALKWPGFASGTFAFSPAIAEGTLDRHHMSDWIDNAMVAEVANPEVRYGWLRLDEVSVQWSLQRSSATQ
jgi:ABC-type polysaccharide/polyol phosphate transport system ATPase subunit